MGRESGREWLVRRDMFDSAATVRIGRGEWICKTASKVKGEVEDHE
jgi:hypothetical protein